MRKIFIMLVMSLVATSANAIENVDENVDEINALKKVNAMIADINGATSQHGSANGISVKCLNGGSKKVTIKFGKGTAKYSAYYNNCKETDSVRDVIYEIKTVDDVIVSDIEKRTANGNLFDAAAANDIVKVRENLKKKVDVNYSEKIHTEDGGIDSWTPLMSAVSNGNLEMVDLLNKFGANINHLNGDVRNALWLATYYGHTNVVKYLLKNNAYYDNSDKDNITPLMIASVKNDIDIAEIFLKHKTNKNSVHKEGDSALMLSIANNNSEIAKKIIDSGADLNIKNKYGITALIIAVAENNVEIAKNLIVKGADLTVKTAFGKTALDIATSKGYAQIVQLLTKTTIQNKAAN